MAPEMWTLLKVLQWTQQRFAERGITTARLDAEVLLAHLLKLDRVGLYTHFDQPLAVEELAAYRELIKRRLAGAPVAYLVGKKEFRSLDLAVSSDVLVPRPDTELAVEVALTLAASIAEPHLCDVGTGSGAIALALKAARPEAKVTAIDVSPAALAVARANGVKLGLEVEFLDGNLFSAVAGRRFEVIVSNPPYIPTGELAGLAAEVRAEPRLALDGGADGLDVLRPLIAGALGLLTPGGALVVEHGDGQSPSVRALFEAAGFREVAAARDLAGTERVVSGRYMP